MIDLFTRGLISEESAMLNATTKGAVSRGIDKVKKERGEDTSGIAGLTIDLEYGKR